MTEANTCTRPEENSTAPVTLFLMTEKGFEFLRGTLRKYKSLFSLVVVGRDKSIQKDFEEEIIRLCTESSIPFIRRSDFLQVQTEYAIAISWRWLISHPAEKLIVFHDSPLPKYRGFSPLVNSLINGEKEIGVTAIFGANDFDSGDIIAQSRSDISYPIKISHAIQLNNKNYLSCAERVLDKLLSGELIAAEKQDDSEASYSVWRDEQDYKIDWCKTADEIRRLIDAVGFPYRGASTTLDGRLVRILSAKVARDVCIENRHCGKVLFISDGKPLVICGKGLLEITEAHIEEDGRITSLFPLTKFRIRFTNS